jgi:hypothetical protein
MLIKNLQSDRSGREVPNQYNIQIKDMTIFQSYQTVIAAVKNQVLYIDKDFYSRTTSKYLNIWIREFARNYTERKEVSNNELLEVLEA